MINQSERSGRRRILAEPRKAAIFSQKEEWEEAKTPEGGPSNPWAQSRRAWGVSRSWGGCRGKGAGEVASWQSGESRQGSLFCIWGSSLAQQCVDFGRETVS